MSAFVIQQTEADWQAAVIEYAELRGWSWMHVLRAFAKGRWLTNTQGSLGKGWPDLVLLRGPRMVVVELKAQKAPQPSTDQLKVLGAFVMVPCAEVYVWRPGDLAQVMEVLA